MEGGGSRIADFEFIFQHRDGRLVLNLKKYTLFALCKKIKKCVLCANQLIKI